MSESDLKLVYFEGGRGRVEPMVLTLHAAGVKFQDYRFPHENFMKEKPDAPYGLFPYMVYKGKKYGESKAIATFVSKLCGMGGKSDEEAMRIDITYCLAGALLDELYKSFAEPDATKKAELQKAEKAELVPKYMTYYEKLVTDNGSTGFMVGSSLTLADVTVFDITDTVLQRYPDALQSYPGLRAVNENVQSHPGVKAYLASRKPSPL